MFRTMLVVAAFAALISYGLESSQRVTFAVDAAESASPVVIELFTSQGCSSCPPADRLLTEIDSLRDEHGLPIYCLSFHVDYWNSLGWKDPYSSKLYTQRQRDYSAAFRSNRVYTPQMIVNGETEFVGSRGADAKAALRSALATPATTAVTLQATLTSDEASADVEFRVRGHERGSVLNVALVQDEVANEVPRGENAGRELAHVQVVRALKAVSLDEAKGKVKLKLSPDLATGALGVIAYVQDPRSMRISGAAAVGL